jgi:hypothetical protein
MIVQCHKCNKYFDDEFRTYVCPHDAFTVNDGDNNFEIHHDSYLSADAPQPEKSNT